MPKALNVLTAIFLLFTLLPFLSISLILAALSTRSTGVFTQIRIGQDGKPFTIYKLQTMINGKVTYIGRILRKSKIDELPQLLNILKGDMSFVGPRPDVPGYYDVLKGEQRKVLILKPGLTSLAAIKYRNEEQLLAQQADSLLYNDTIIFPDKVRMNLDYLKKRSFWYDLKIIGLTIKSLFN
ncbi:sugar transferase [uncultured Nonlabens sp.]|uniref:sugar transferase n=1 Tax=uncultured Nonlabens sp. TaxID=859306 RepID=UPI00261BB1D7|nr:sugar transferase [uncultured Nonlabens sp.]